jgi:hypothetical protein
MNRGRVGEERGSKETDGCPLTVKDLVTLVVEDILWSCYMLRENQGS